MAAAGEPARRPSLISPPAADQRCQCGGHVASSASIPHRRQARSSRPRGAPRPLAERLNACCVARSLSRRALRLARAFSTSSSSSSSGIRASAGLATVSSGAAASSARRPSGAAAGSAAARTARAWRPGRTAPKGLVRAACIAAAGGGRGRRRCVEERAHGSGHLPSRLRVRPKTCGHAMEAMRGLPGRLESGLGCERASPCAAGTWRACKLADGAKSRGRARQGRHGCRSQHFTAERAEGHPMPSRAASAGPFFRCAPWRRSILLRATLPADDRPRSANTRRQARWGAL